MSNENVAWHQENRARIVALEERCKTLETAVSILQRRLDDKDNSEVIHYNLSLDREIQR